MFSEGITQKSTLTFKTLSGDLIVKKEDTLLVMDFPAANSNKIEIPKETAITLASYFSLEENSFLEYNHEAKSQKLIILLRNYSDLLKAKANTEKLLELKFPVGVKGISLTTQTFDIPLQHHTSGPYDFASRYFAPWVGIPEDPVNGSSHTILTPYYAERLKKTSFLA